jgi:CDP-diacylglycerol--serine O-phosphatidyltransferase
MFDRFRPRYLVPNGVTALSMALAAAAILLARDGRYEMALWLLVWSVLLDRVDGVVARLLDAASAFGEQFDTLADMLAFCVAPPVVLIFLLTGDPRYAEFFSGGAARAGLIAAAAVYLLLGAARLARFNVEAAVIGHRWFRGLPTPIAAGIVCTCVLAAWEISAPVSAVLALPLLLVACGLLMVSTFWLPKSVSISPALLIPGAAVIYGLGLTCHYPILLFLAAIAYPAVGFSIAPSLRRRAASANPGYAE